MNELVYLMRVAEDEELFDKIATHLQVAEIPHWIRVSTLAPLSTYGFAPGAEGALLRWSNAGITFGLPDDPNVPRAFVPWQNIAYIAEGDTVIQELSQQKAFDSEDADSAAEEEAEPAAAP